MRQFADFLADGFSRRHTKTFNAKAPGRKGKIPACTPNRIGVLAGKSKNGKSMSENQSQTPPPIQPPSPPTPVIPPSPESQARTWNMLCHLSALAGFVIPFGNILGPLLVWQIKKNEIPSVEAHGKAALNFQITVTIAALIGMVVAIVLSFVCVGFLLIPLVILIGLAGLVFAIIAGIKANDGKDYKYPFSFNLIK
jgi:uncharacterized Tic20 family protein